jgi:methylated-DNA-[protein]-cysteine S-methyltransferase
MMLAGVGGVMAGRGYTIFDTGLGRCGIAWADNGVIGVQLPEAREIETRGRMLRQYPDAREQRPPLNIEIAIEGITALLRGQVSDLSDVALDMTGIPTFNQRVYEFTRTIPRGETRTYGEVAASLRASGASHSVAQAISKNPFMVIVPCGCSKRAAMRTGSRPTAAASPSAGCFRSKALAEVSPARPCSTCCCRLRRPARRPKFVA